MAKNNIKFEINTYSKTKQDPKSSEIHVTSIPFLDFWLFFIQNSPFMDKNMN